MRNLLIYLLFVLLFVLFNACNRCPQGNCKPSKKQYTYTLEIHFTSGNIDTVNVDSRCEPSLYFERRSRYNPGTGIIYGCGYDEIAINVDFFQILDKYEK